MIIKVVASVVDVKAQKFIRGEVTVEGYGWPLTADEFLEIERVIQSKNGPSYTLLALTPLRTETGDE